MKENDSDELISMTEQNERARFARDLHDGLGSLLFGIHLHIEALKHVLNGEHKEIINNLSEMTQSAISATKEIAHNTTPSFLNKSGLIDALKEFIQKITTAKDVSIEFDYSLSISLENTMIETTLYYIVCELITNTLKHTEAKHIEIDLNNSNNKISLSYKDDGCGMIQSDKNNGFGMQSIEERIALVGGTVKYDLPEGRKGLSLLIEI